MDPNNRYQERRGEEPIDLFRLLYFTMQGAKRFLVWGVVLTVLLAGAGYLYGRLTYQPVYESSASVIVTDSITTDQTSSELTLASQIGNTFAYIVKSGLLRNVVAKDLQVSEIKSTITAAAVSGTNLLTISVRDSDPQMAYDVLNSVLKNYSEVTEYVLGATKMEIVQPGELADRPANWANAGRMTGIGAAAGAGLFLAACLLYALTRKTAGNAGDVQQKTGAEFLTNIPSVTVKKRSKKAQNRLTVAQKSVNQGFVEGFRILANRVVQDAEQAPPDKPRQVYVVTSAISGEGKSTVAMNLAMVLSRRGKRVLLLDADLRKASVTEMTGLKDAPHTLQSYLNGKSGWEEVLQKYYRGRLFVLPASAAESGEQVMRLLSGKHFAQLLQRARQSFDFVVIDTPPLGILADGAGVIAQSDGVVLVTKQDYAPISEIEETIFRVEENGGRMVGFVMNQVSRSMGNYGYGYGYGYGYSYAASRDYGAYADNTSS